MHAAPPAPELVAQRRRVIASGICALILTVGLGRFAYTPLLPIMQSGAGLGPVSAGWLATLNYAGYMAGALLAALIPRLGPKFVLYRIGLVLAVVGTVGMGLTRDPVLWLFLRFIAGLSSSAGMLLASGLVLNWLIRSGLRPELGLHFSGAGLGIVVSGLAVAALQPLLRWDGIWIGLAVLGVALALPAWAWMPAPADDLSRRGSSAAAAPSRAWSTLFTASYVCAGFGYVTSATYIVAIAVRLPQLAAAGNWVWVLVGLAAAPSSFLWDRIATAIGQNRALLLGFALQTVSIVLPAISATPASYLVAAVLYGGTFVGIVNLTLSIVGRHAPANPAKAMARMTLGYGVAQIAGPALAGYMAAASGSYRGALLLTAACMVIGMGMLLAIGRLEARGAA